jgi:hypothetical protein
MDDKLYTVKVIADGETFKYEYGNLKHAREHYNMEVNDGNLAYIYEYDFKTGKTSKIL